MPVTHIQKAFLFFLFLVTVLTWGSVFLINSNLMHFQVFRSLLFFPAGRERGLGISLLIKGFSGPVRCNWVYGPSVVGATCRDFQQVFNF